MKFFYADIIDMSKQIYHYFKKLYFIKNYILHFFITLLVGGGIFGIIQTISAQIPSGFLVTNTINTGNYITTGNYGTINFSGLGLTPLFHWYWNGLTTKFYEPEGNTIYFNNFDTPSVLEQNQVPLADSIRDFTGGIDGIGKNGRIYFYENSLFGERELNELNYDSIDNIRKIGNNDIIYHNFANIGKYYSHPGSGTINSLPNLSGKTNIPIVWYRNSPFTGTIKIINTITDDENNCGNGIVYGIFKHPERKNGEDGNIIDPGELQMISSETLENNTITIEEDINVNLGDSILFRIHNNLDNQCDGTWNWIQIYDITDNSEITGGPSYTENGKYGGALDFSGNQQFSLGDGINQSASGITIAAWINTRDYNQSQGIITKQFSYGVVLKQGTIRISPSTYWMWHDTGIPINSNERTHVAWTYNGQTMRAYKNGSQIWSYNINGELNGNDSLAMIGYDELNQRGRNGLIDEFRMYDIAFTTGQIQELYESNLKLVDSGSNSSWNFIINKTGLVDGIYDYGYTPLSGLLLSTGDYIDDIDIVSNSTPYFNYIPICLNCNSDICTIGTFNNIGYFLNNKYICRAQIFYDQRNNLNDDIVLRYHTYILEAITGSIAIDQHGPILTGSQGRQVYESQSLILTTTWYDTGMSKQITGGFDRGRGWDINGARDIATNTGNTMYFGIEDEPTNKQIKIRIVDHIGNISYLTGIISRLNTGPVINDIYNTYTVIVEDDIIFLASGYDIGGEPLNYKRYNGLNCSGLQIITGAIEQIFATGSDIIYTGEFSYKIFDQQGSGSICWNITGIRKEPEINQNFNVFLNTGKDLLGGVSTDIINDIFLGGTVIKDGNIGTCSITTSQLNYVSYSTGIGNDYCIVSLNSGDIIIVGRYNIRIFNTITTLTGQILTKDNLSGAYAISENIPALQIQFQNIDFTEFDWLISGTGKTIFPETEKQIYSDGLIGLYNFDKILLTDSEKDFSPIQSGKNRTYIRRPRGTQEYTGLQYYSPSQQRVISTPIGDYDGFFIEKNELNPGYNYGDAVLGRTSPVSANIEIEYTLTDANTNLNCGDGIRYKLLKNSDILATGYFESKTITTGINKGETIYMVINSINSNDCDNTNYNIKIYQLPETNLAIDTTPQSRNSGALYSSGKYYGALNFTDNKYVSIGTGVQSGNMSISARVYKGSGANQTIIQKRGSYGIVLYNNELQVTNQNTTRRYNTQITLPDDTRTHIGRSYDGINMKVYINGKQQRSGTVLGTIPNNNNQIYIGYSFSNGGRNGLIDEIYIYNYAIDSFMFSTLYEHNLNKITRDKRTWTSNQSGSINDGHFNFIGTIGLDDGRGSFIRDFTTPIITGFIGLTGFESDNLTITGFGYDSGSYISGYQFRYTITGNILSGERSDWSTGNTFIISGQDEPITGLIEIKVQDIFGYETIGTGNIEWINTGPIINGISEFYGKIGQNINFIASGYDIGGEPLSYQWYTNTGCSISNQISGKTGYTFITGSIISDSINFSYNIFDKQGSGSCKNIIGTWTDDESFINYTLYLTGDGAGGTISGNRSNIIGIESSYGIQIIKNGKYGTGILTGTNKDIINYIPNTGSKENDSCIVELSNGKYLIIAFTNINTEFINYRIPDISSITNDINNILRTSKISTPTINFFTGIRSGETSQGSGILINNIDIITDNLIRKYSFDKIELTDSTKDFGYFQGEHGRKYFWDNGTTGGELIFNPNTKNRIINEPLQDYEYIFINNSTAYPGSTKYGNIIYERTSNITGNITIETIISNANAPSCPTTNGIYYTILNENTNIYTNDMQNLSDSSTTGTYIKLGDKIKFIIDSKNDNQCDKINFNVKIYQNSTNDYSLSGKHLTGYGITYDNGKYYGAYGFGSSTGQYIDIGVINQKTGLTFSAWIKTNSTENQNIIYKSGSYGLTIKDGIVKVTTDGGRRYPTNTNTTTLLTNGNRNHLVQTYDGNDMKIYINGQQTRSERIVGYYPTNGNSTIIGRHTNHGQFNGSIDELQIRNKTLNINEIQNLYHTQLSKLDAKTREFSLIQTGLADGLYTFTGYINNTDMITGTTIIDNDPPVLEIKSLYTGDEATGIIINITGWDNGIGIISGYEYSWTINNSNPSTEATGITGWITGTDIVIPTQNEPTNGTLIIKVKDSLGHQTQTGTTIQRINIPMITVPLYKTALETENITFMASGYDLGGTTNTGYQRYSGYDCLIILTGITSSGFTTGFNEPGTKIFSYKMFDKQGTGLCNTATGNRTNTIPTAKDLYINANGDVNITFTATGSDPGGTDFNYQRYLGTGCENIITNQTGQIFTTGSEKSGTRTFSYYIRDAQGATGKNNINTSRYCQIATGYRPYINPVANDFNISSNTSNKLVTGDRRSLSNARDPEFNTIIIANISSGSKGYCQVTNDWVSFQPMNNQIGTGYCELTLTDGNNRSTKINAYALNIDTTPPTTTITGQNYTSFELEYDDTSTGISYYKILVGVRNVSSCGISGYTPYNGQVTLSYTPNITDYRTVCYYSQDIYGNTESINSKLFTQPQDAVPFNVSFFADEFINNIFEATINVNKACTGTLTGLAQNKNLSLIPGTNTITGSFTENNGEKTAYIILQTTNTGELFTHSHTFTIDQISPSTPVITENTENNDYYIIKRNASIDETSGIKGYNYEISNQYTTIKTGFTDVTYLNILKSEVQYNSQISIKIQAKDNVNNVSSRSNPRSITIIQQQLESIDTTPNQFSFTKTTSAKRETIYTSNEIIIGGLSTNTSIPISLSAGDLFINDTKITDNSSTVKNGDIVYIQLESSEEYNDATQATLIANGVSATYTITTEIKVTSSTTSFLDELKKLLEQLQKEDTSTNTNTDVIDTNIDNTRISAPHIAPNGKVYNLYKTIDGRYSSSNFVIKKYFTSLSEMKSYIDKNNPR